MSVNVLAYERLRGFVVSGDLVPGSRLAELPLASRLGVSRPTVREALRRLEASGLARSDGRGVRVALMDERELHSALLMRASLEGLHAELAALRVRQGEVAAAQLRDVHELARATERAMDAGDHRRAVIGNRAFHQALDVLADSPVSAAAVDRLWDRIVVSTRRSLLLPERAVSVNREHRELLGAVTAGEPERAGGLATRHVRATWDAGRLGSRAARQPVAQSAAPLPDWS